MRSLPAIITINSNTIDHIATVVKFNFEINRITSGSNKITVNVIDDKERDPEQLLRNFCNKWCNDKEQSDKMFSELIIIIMKNKIKIK